MDANSALLLIDNKISSAHKLMLSDKLSKASESQINSLAYLSFKSPILALVLSIFFGWFGVDRFYQGNYFIAILKLLIAVVLFFLSFIGIGLFLSPIYAIFVFIDWFLVFRAVKQDNFKKILKAIE